MKFKVQQLMDATVVIAQIIREQRHMPQRGKYRLARLHAKLVPEFDIANAVRDKLIIEHGVKQTAPTTDAAGVVTMAETGQWWVPPENLEAFTAAWKPTADLEIEVDVEPLLLADIDAGDANGAIESSELAVLGDLVTE